MLFHKVKATIFKYVFLFAKIINDTYILLPTLQVMSWSLGFEVLFSFKKISFEVTLLHVVFDCVKDLHCVYRINTNSIFVLYIIFFQTILSICTNFFFTCKAKLMECVHTSNSSSVKWTAIFYIIFSFAYVLMTHYF